MPAERHRPTEGADNACASISPGSISLRRGLPHPRRAVEAGSGRAIAQLRRGEPRHRFGRTMVGNSRLAPEAWAPFAVPFLSGEIPENPVAGLSPALVDRYVADDMKSLYAEAAQAIGPQPS